MSNNLLCFLHISNLHFVVPLEGGPQAGGAVHPPSPEGWLPGEVQSIPRIYSWSKNTRTLENLEWFGPPERNTLRPLRVVLLLDLWMSLSSPPRLSLDLSLPITGVSLL